MPSATLSLAPIALSVVGFPPMETAEETFILVGLNLPVKAAVFCGTRLLGSVHTERATASSCGPQPAACSLRARKATTRTSASSGYRTVIYHACVRFQQLPSSW